MSRRRLSRSLPLAALIAASLAAVSWAYFSAAGAGTAAASVGSVLPATAVTATQSSTAVQISWSAASLSSGAGVQGYRVTRSDGTTVCGTPTLLTTLSCSDSTGIAGETYSYTVVAVYHSFSASASSGSITILSAPTLTATPSNPSANAAPSFSISGGSGSGYQCQLDGGSFTSCSTNVSYTGLGNGSHTFKVHAVSSGSTGPDTSYTWTVDAAAPSITSAPGALSATSAPSFSFSHTKATYTFECQLDGGGFSSCSSPLSYSGLSNASHTFKVEAVSADGATTAVTSYTWTIDSSAPSITAKPANPTTSTSASFSFAHTEAGYTFQCQLDGGGFASCSSPKAYTSLAQGSHTFQVLAVAADGTHTQIAGYTWVVDSIAPTDSLSLALGASGAYMNGSGTTLYYKGNVAGSFGLIDTVSDSGSGPASATFPTLSTTGWTHSAQTVSGATPYTSSTFSWTQNPSNPSGYTVTSKDAAGNASSGTTPTFVNDTTAPGGSAALTVNGAGATAVGTTSSTTSTSFTIGTRTDYTEAQSGTQSGLSSSSLVVISETLTSGTCGAAGSGGPFAGGTLITGTTQPSGIVAGFCYDYILQGIDNVSNSALVQTTVKVTSAPTVTSTSPSSLDRGATAQTVLVNGTGFLSGATASFSGTLVTVNGSPTFVSATQLSLNVTVASGAAIGSRNLTVTNPDGGTATGTNVFTVVAAPTIASLSPAALGLGATAQTVTVTGTSFDPGTSLGVTLTGAGDTGVTVNSTTYVSPTTLTISVSVASNATLATNYAANLTNGDGTTATLPSAFAVHAAPTISSLSPAALGQGAANKTVTVTGAGFLAGTPLAATITGHLGVTVNSVSRTSSTVLSLNVSVDPSAAIASDYAVNVTNGDGGTASKANGFAVDGAPTVTSTSPTSRGQGASNQNITITGTGFVTGAAATFGASGITVNSTTFNSATQVTANIAISAGATTGPDDVTVTNPDAGVGTGANLFTVNAAPTVTSTSPSSLDVGATAQTVLVNGTGFVSGASASFSGTLVTVNGSPTFVSATQLSLSVTVASGATVGSRNLTVTNPDGGTATGTNVFTVVAAPTIASLSPAALGQGATAQIVTLTGTHFDSGTSLGVTLTGAGDSGVTVNSTTYVNSTTLTLSVSVASNATVATNYAANLTNGDGSTATLANAFTVHVSPTITSLSPATLGQGAASKTVTVTGTGFLAGSLLDASITGHPGVIVNSVAWTSSTTLTLHVSVAPSAAIASDYTVNITNGDGGLASKANAFAVDGPPTVTSTLPSAADEGAINYNVVITGTGFVSGAGLVAHFSNPDVTVSSTTFNSSTQVTAKITISGSTTTGVGDVTVTNPDGGTGTGTGVFTVDPAPTVTSTSPSSGDQGASSYTIAINGTNFESGATVAFNGSQNATATVTFISATQLNAVVTIPSNGTTGLRTVTVTNPDGSTAAASVFTVNAKPTVTAASPSAGDQGASTLNVALTGTIFESGAAATFSGTGITVNSTTFNSTTSLTANISIAAGATTGARNVTVTNPDNSATLASSLFTVNGAPTVTSASPSSRGQGVTQSITITGTNFETGANATFSGSGITVNSTTGSGTSLTANISIAVDATPGARNITVTNPDNTTATANSAFTVDAAPLISSISPSSLAQGETSQSVTITGTGFVSGSGLAATFSGSGITVNSTTFNSLTQVTAVVTLSAAATVGPSDVTITNPDGGSSTCTGCMHIFGFSEAASATATSGSLLTSSSFTLTAGTSYIVTLYSKSVSGDSATPSIGTSFTANPAFNLIGPQQDYNASAEHNWAWYLTGGSGSGTIKITLGKTTAQAYLEVIAVTGANTSSPVATANEAFAVSGGSAASTATSNPATAALGAPAPGNAELIFWSSAQNVTPSITSPFAAVAGTLAAAAAGSDELFDAAPATSSAISIQMASTRNWGTIAMEINHS